LWVAGAAKAALKKLVGFSFENYELFLNQESLKVKVKLYETNHSSHARDVSNEP